jgi:hypothetical protein
LVGHNDRRRWTLKSEGFERAAAEGRTWRVRPVSDGWRLERIDPAAVGWLGGSTSDVAEPVWDAATPEACKAMVAHIERHETYAAWVSEQSEAVDRPSPVPGIRLKGQRRGQGVSVTAYREGGDESVGMYGAKLSGWLPTWVLGEPTFNGGSSVSNGFVGKGLGRAMYDLAEELAGVPLTPHGRFGTTGSRTALSHAFWDKRAAAQRVPGVGDPAVAERDAERVRVQALLDMVRLPGRARDPYLAAAVSSATGWDVVYVRVSDEGDLHEAWCVGPDGMPFSGMGPDDGVPSPPRGRNEGAVASDAVRVDGATYLGILEGSPWNGPRSGDHAARHRAYAATHADGASAALARYAGMSVAPDAIRESLLERDRPGAAPSR